MRIWKGVDVTGKTGRGRNFIAVALRASRSIDTRRCCWKVELRGIGGCFSAISRRPVHAVFVLLSLCNDVKGRSVFWHFVTLLMTAVSSRGSCATHTRIGGVSMSSCSKWDEDLCFHRVLRESIPRLTGGVIDLLS